MLEVVDEEVGRTHERQEHVAVGRTPPWYFDSRSKFKRFECMSDLVQYPIFVIFLEIGMTEMMQQKRFQIQTSGYLHAA